MTWLKRTGAPGRETDVPAWRTAPGMAEMGTWCGISFRPTRRLLLAAGVAALPALPAHAGQADVIGATVRQRTRNVFDFDVTIRSNDTGWDAYADRIEVLGPDGAILRTRVLEHPHEQEQPFTRDVYDVTIPRGIGTVTIRAHHKAAGFDGAICPVKLPSR
jgi:hypothetical protein